jgi:hypothetical protein
MSLSLALGKLTSEIKTDFPIALLAAFSNVFSISKRRIFNLGQADDNTQIGNYSTKPAWFGIDSFTVKSAFHPAKGRKTEKFDDGYKGLREAQGFQTDKVDLQYSNALFLSYQFQQNGNGSIDVGFTDKQNFNKAKGNEKRFKKTVFYLSVAEIALLEKEVIVQIGNRIASRTT